MSGPMVLTIAGQDVSGVTLYDATVQIGRDSLDSQPDATVLEAQLEGWRPAGQLGDAVTLTDAIGMLFHGKLTDLVTTLDTAANTYWSTRISAVGPLSDVGRVYVGDEPWPQESDSARIARVLTLANAPHAVNPGILGPLMLPRDVDHQTALDIAQGTAADALGVLWEQPSDPVTPIRYTPQRFRQWESVPLAWDELPTDQTWDALPPTMTWDQWDSGTSGSELTMPELHLDAGMVLADIELSQQIGDLVRKVRVTYGPDSDPRAAVVLGDGIPELSRDTQLADVNGATTVADTLWRSRREPAWRMQSVNILLSRIDAAREATIRAALAVGTHLTVSGIAFDAPTGSVWEGYIEGWTHQLRNSGDHWLTLQVAERRLIEPAMQWQDIPPGLTWDQIDPGLTWDDIAKGT